MSPRVRALWIPVLLAGFVIAQTSAPPPGVTPAKSAVSASAEKDQFPLDSLTEFSATMVGGILGNIDEQNIYRSGNLMRTDMLDGKNYMITKLDTLETFGVLPNQCMHDTRPALNTFPFSAYRPGNKVARKDLGTESVDGHACTVEEVTITSERGKNLTLKLWEANDLSGFPIKVEIQRKTGPPATITYKNVKIGKPDPALFKYPADCGAPPAKKKPAAKAGSSSSKKTPSEKG